MSSKQSRLPRRKRLPGVGKPPWRKGHDLGLRLAIMAAGKRAGVPRHRRYSAGKKWLAEGLGIKVQSINHWHHIPKDRLMMVHMLTAIPLEKLSPLFKSS